MLSKTTLPLFLQPLMGKPSLKLDRCAVCGKAYPLNQHHIVRRGAGKLFNDRGEVKKPTITLCGSGNASGCHGLAHQGRLFFRWAESSKKPTDSLKSLYTPQGGHWEYLLTEEPMKAFDALQVKEDWKRCGR